MNTKILIIDDMKDILDLYQGIFPCAADADEAINLIKAGGIERVYCDFHGIQKNGKSAYDVIELCKELNISCFVTSGDLVIQGEMMRKGVKVVDKCDAMRESA